MGQPDDARVTLHVVASAAGSFERIMLWSRRRLLTVRHYCLDARAATLPASI